MTETPAQIEDKKTPESKYSFITKAKQRIQSLLSEIRGRMGDKPEKKKQTNNPTDKAEEAGKGPPKIDGDDGYDENNLPEYIQAIDGGENPM